MRVEAMVYHKGEKVPITKNIKKINVIYVDQNKQLYHFTAPFQEFPEWCHVTINKITYAFSKKHICWEYLPKWLHLRKNDCWEPYILMMDSNAHEAMMP